MRSERYSQATRSLRLLAKRAFDYWDNFYKLWYFRQMRSPIFVRLQRLLAIGLWAGYKYHDLRVPEAPFRSHHNILGELVALMFSSVILFSRAATYALWVKESQFTQWQITVSSLNDIIVLLSANCCYAFIVGCFVIYYLISIK